VVGEGAGETDGVSTSRDVVVLELDREWAIVEDRLVVVLVIVQHTSKELEDG